MDYNQAALKLLCGQLLKKARQTSSQSAMTFEGIRFQRAWVQGILVSSSGKETFVLDDGSGVIELLLTKEFPHSEWKIGMYVMVVGLYVVRADKPPMIKVQKMVDLSASPDREAMWHLEVIEAYKFFYQTIDE